MKPAPRSLIKLWQVGLLLGMAVGGIYPVPYCFGQTETNVAAVGDWSEPATDQGIHGFWTLRGRLVVKSGPWPGARVYVELQNAQTAKSLPIEVQFDRGLRSPHLHFELSDASGKPIPHRFHTIFDGGPLTDKEVRGPFTATLPSDSTLRFPAESGLSSSEKPDGLWVDLCGGSWFIPSDDARRYFLSATFSWPTNGVDSRTGHLWQGTLKLPKVKIPIKKP